MNKPLLLLATATVLLSASGCKAMRTHACMKPGAYVGAENGKPLVVPAGMDAPDTRASLRIPELKQTPKVRTAADGCLDEPPKFAIPAPAKPAA